MSGPAAGSQAHLGWWAVDVAGFLLSRLAALPGVKPAQLDVDAAISWIRSNELEWAPGCADLQTEVPWDQLRGRADDADLVGFILNTAAAEIVAEGGVEGACRFAACRHLPTSTLHAFGVAPSALPPAAEDECADGHVHQGASLPLEVTLHWVAGRYRSIGRAADSFQPSMTDTTGLRFSPSPLLLLLRHLVERSNDLDAELLPLAVQAATDGGDAWDKLDARIGFSEVSSQSLPKDAKALTELKQKAISNWARDRFTAMLKVESILHAALTQRQPGLDVFVQVFEQLSAIRRGELDKELYFEKSIQTHCSSSGYELRNLELRLGEPISATPVRKRDLVKQYEQALGGYRRYIEDQERPVRVTFPLGLVKSTPGSECTAENWRYDARGIYELIETLLEVLEAHPELSPFVDGIDVCGWEVGEPNWLFAPAFERFARETVNLNPPPACRFHAGEWQWSPLSGLRRIAEFLRFDLPPRTPRRLGHGLTMSSNNWRDLGHQPVDELLDDLIWSRERMARLEAPASRLRLIDRLILDLRPVVYSAEVARQASVEELIDAYAARFDTEALVAISFLRRCRSGRLSFSDDLVGTRSQHRLQLLAAHLGSARPSPRTIAKALEDGSLGGLSLHGLRDTLGELYHRLAPEIVDDVRWSRTVVEACPSSNVMVGGVRGLDRHPMREFVEAGLLVTVNSDDPSLFHHWIRDELAHAKGGMGVPKEQVERSRKLGLQITAPDLPGPDLRAELDGVLRRLRDPVVAD